MLTQSGIEEIKSALVGDKVGFALARIELLAFRTNCDPQRRTGSIPLNVPFFPKEQFSRAIKAMQTAFAQGICAGRLAAIAQEGEKLGQSNIPPGKAGLATVCSIIIYGALLKAGIRMDCKFIEPHTIPIMVLGAALATGLFATLAVSPDGANGLFYDHPQQFLTQLFALAVVWAYSFGTTWIILKILYAAMGLRLKTEEEVSRAGPLPARRRGLQAMTEGEK